MTIGARVLKTGLAVALSMLICNFLNLQPSLFAGAATVLSLQPSLGLSINKSKEQFLSLFSSLTLAIILGLTLGSNPFIMGLATIGVIALCNYFKWTTVSSGVMAAIFVLASPADQFLSHALIRSAAIFVGVSVALAVNMTIARPHYKTPLREKLSEINSVITRAFIQSVQSYLSVVVLTPEELKERNDEVQMLFRECQKLYDFYILDLGTSRNFQLFDREDTSDNERQFLREYLTYNRGLWQRTKDINFLAQERKERRKKIGETPISPEFQEVLNVLKNALELFQSYNELAVEKLLGKPVSLTEEPHVWRKLDEIINHWHSHHTGSYHLHALIEVSLITYKIRWAVKESAHLLTLELPPDWENKE